MCTVTVIDLPDGGWRVACNRDELRSRPLAKPPESSQRHNIEAVYPIDAQSGGTWIGVNQAGLLATLLNVNPYEPASVPPDAPSRGELVPKLLAESQVPAALRLLGQLDLRSYAPFRLVLLDEAHVVTVRQVHGDLTISPLEPRDRALFYTSSGLGDHLVEKQRSELFRSWSRQSWDADRQDEFHAHRWLEWPELSVNMSRKDALTVSYTTVTITSRSISMRYHPGQPDVGGEDFQTQLVRQESRT